MRVESTHLDGVLLLEPERHHDHRGFLSEVYSERALAQLGIDVPFVQQNHTLSLQSGTVRGLHFQAPPRPAAKLVRVVAGSIFDVAVDVRGDSTTFGKHVSAVLSAENWLQMFIPEGFAHGFCTLEPATEVVYLVSDYWVPELDRGLAWDDPDLGIDWPVDPSRAVLSDKDRSQPPLAAVEWANSVA